VNHAPAAASEYAGCGGQPERGDVKPLADRLDGRPATEATVTLQKRDACDWTRAELVEFLRNASHQVDEVEARELKVIEAPKPIATTDPHRAAKRTDTH
jgi:hypothetical protein